ncbi:MAG: MBL fold metallo-hydrolase [Ferrimicrobium sp.]
MAITVADGLIEIDTLLGGWEHLTAGFVVSGKSPVLIETGSQSSVPQLLKELASLGIDASNLAGIVVTHIHLDHAGGLGDLAIAFPNATIYVHPEGARHLVNPRKLIDSASRVYGPLLDGLYGRLNPTPAERIVTLNDGDAIRITKDLELVALHTPGHAKHHLSLWHEPTGTMFCGDAVGVRLPEVGVLWPATPPPDFDLGKVLSSLSRMAERKPQQLAFAHYGIVPNAVDLLTEGGELIRRWCEVAAMAREQSKNVVKALESAFLPDLDKLAPEARARLLTLSGVHANASGLERWLSSQEKHGGGSGI